MYFFFFIENLIAPYSFLKGAVFLAAIFLCFGQNCARPNITKMSFYALVGLLVTKLNHYFDDSIDSNIFFAYSK